MGKKIAIEGVEYDADSVVKGFEIAQRMLKTFRDANTSNHSIVQSTIFIQDGLWDLEQDIKKKAF